MVEGWARCGGAGRWIVCEALIGLCQKPHGTGLVNAEVRTGAELEERSSGCVVSCLLIACVDKYLNLLAFLVHSQTRTT
jgi:hypothetical protein